MIQEGTIDLWYKEERSRVFHSDEVTKLRPILVFGKTTKMILVW